MTSPQPATATTPDNVTPIQPPENPIAAPVRRNLYQKIADIMKTVKYVGKDTTVSTGKDSYKAVSHDAVVGALHDCLAEHGIIVLPRKVAAECLDSQTRHGNYKLIYRATFDIDFINADEPEDRFTVTLDAHAEDGSDKAPGKAVSYAQKTALLKVFNLKTGENDETRLEDTPPVDKPTRSTPAPAEARQPSPPAPNNRKRALFAEAKRAGMPSETFKAEVKRIYSLESFTTLSADQADWLQTNMSTVAERLRKRLIRGLHAACDKYQLDAQRLHDYLLELGGEGDGQNLSIEQAETVIVELKRWKAEQEQAEVDSAAPTPVDPAAADESTPPPVDADTVDAETLATLEKVISRDGLLKHVICEELGVAKLADLPKAKEASAWKLLRECSELQRQANATEQANGQPGEGEQNS